MFQLLNKELSFDIETSAIGCGMNFALYFISMEADGGKASAGFSGAQYGTGYCDAQGQGREACPEFDIWEANSLVKYLNFVFVTFTEFTIEFLIY